MTDQPRTIIVDYDLPQPPDKVWRALTEPALLGAWLMENDIAPVVGHRFNFRSKPIGGWDGIVHCEVLVAEAPLRLRYTWQSGGTKEKGFGSNLDTVVTWTLTKTDGGTKLTLEHAGFQPKDQFAFDNMGNGWRGPIADRITKVLATG